MGNESPGGETAKGTSPNVWTAIIVAVLMGGLIGILAIVLHAFSKAEEAGAILGVIVPAIATLGAAAFGVTVAYKAAGGKAEAEAGQAEAEAGKAEAEAELQGAEKDAKKVKGTSEATISHLQTVEEALKRIVGPVTEASSSPIGERDLLLQPVGRAEPVKIHRDDIDEATKSIAAAQTNLQNLLRAVPE